VRNDASSPTPGQEEKLRPKVQLSGGWGRKNMRASEKTSLPCCFSPTEKIGKELGWPKKEVKIGEKDWKKDSQKINSLRLTMGESCLAHCRQPRIQATPCS
jgi:hypothetical protein